MLCLHVRGQVGFDLEVVRTNHAPVVDALHPQLPQLLLVDVAVHVVIVHMLCYGLFRGYLENI